MRTIDIIAGVLLIIGGLNWGLVGLFDFNLVGYVFGSMPMMGKLVYDLVGLSAVYKIVSCRCCCKK